MRDMVYKWGDWTVGVDVGREESACVLIARKGETMIVVGDAHGPVAQLVAQQAVRISELEAEAETLRTLYQRGVSAFDELQATTREQRETIERLEAYEDWLRANEPDAHRLARRASHPSKGGSDA